MRFLNSQSEFKTVQVTRYSLRDFRDEIMEVVYPLYCTTTTTYSVMKKVLKCGKVLNQSRDLKLENNDPVVFEFRCLTT